jgi:Ca2+-binding RTX toxin-like protein
MVHIKAANSIDSPSGDALTRSGPDTLIVDAGAFVIAETSGVAARLDGAWTIRINGEVGTFANNFAIDLFSSSGPETSKITIGKTGDVFGGNVALNIGEAATITNFGTISGGGGSASIKANFATHLTNAGTLLGDVLFAEDNDVFTNFKKVGHHIKNGTVVGVIDLGPGDDHFTGGAKAEIVIDAAGADTYKLGGGNDTFIPVNAGSTTGADIVNGGKGIDTYDASAGSSQIINLNTHSTVGADVSGDTLIGFENVIGGNGGDILTGSDVANRLTGGTSGDIFTGLGGRDILTGGAGADIFVFVALSNSGAKASQRDLITDFIQGSDQIDLSQIDAKTSGGDDAFTFIGVQNFTGVKGQLRESFSAGNTIVSGDVNGDGNADFSIALKGHFLLSGVDGEDFFL